MAKFVIGVPDDFSYRFTVRSHGWYDLAPFKLEDDRLSFVQSRGIDGRPVTVCVSEHADGLEIEVEAECDLTGVEADVRRILRIDEDLTEFYSRIEQSNAMIWAKLNGAGRLLRSSTVWEDLVKTICTTNCSWSLTRIMVANLVEKLGEQGKDGRRSFPTPSAMAEMPESFYRDEIRAGYRSPYFIELARSVASSKTDPESWLTSELPTADLKKEMKQVKGVGDYAAENLLKLVGRYDGLALDSWLRAQYYAKHNGGKKCSDSKIARHYRKYGEWQGLAIWCDMTESWFDPQSVNPI
jgi:3-methyladenine DNA glycosylase/8-oxoguanine DNA glycosylase